MPRSPSSFPVPNNGWKRKRWLSCPGYRNTQKNFAKILHVFLILRAPLCYHVFSYPPAVSYGFFLGLQTLRLGWALLCSCVIQTTHRTSWDTTGGTLSSCTACLTENPRSSRFRVLNMYIVARLCQLYKFLFCSIRSLKNRCISVSQQLGTTQMSINRDIW